MNVYNRSIYIYVCVFFCAKLKEVICNKKENDSGIDEINICFIRIRKINYLVNNKFISVIRTWKIRSNEIIIEYQRLLARNSYLCVYINNICYFLLYFHSVCIRYYHLRQQQTICLVLFQVHVLHVYNSFIWPSHCRVTHFVLFLTFYSSTSRWTYCRTIRSTRFFDVFVHV